MPKKGLCVFGWSLGGVLCVLWLGALRAHPDFESENTGCSIITHVPSPQFLGDLKPLLCDKIFDPKVRATGPVLCVFHRLSEDERKRLITNMTFERQLKSVTRAFATFLEYRASQLPLQTQLSEAKLNRHEGFLKWLLMQSGFKEHRRNQEITGVVYKLVQQRDAACYIKEQGVTDVIELLEQQSLDSGVQA
ncbi:MAG: hypothetical protein V6Z78_02440 [Holosporaceae bacterium]